MSAGRRLAWDAAAASSGYGVFDATLRAIGSDVAIDGVLSEYTQAIRQVFAMFIVDGEVNNGGFNQLFFNDEAGWLPDAIDGFEAAGLPGHSDVIRAVIGPAEREQELRSAARTAGTLEAFAATYEETELGEFDDQWYDLEAMTPAVDAFVVERGSDIWDR